MITAEPVSDKALRLTPTGKLAAADFQALAPVVDGMILRDGTIRLLIDASRFDGWDGLGGLDAHARFVRDRQRHVERLAVIVGHDWQRWLIDTTRWVLHPEARAYDKNREAEALDWIRAA